jgi:hypothetical protein
MASPSIALAIGNSTGLSAELGKSSHRGNDNPAAVWLQGDRKENAWYRPMVEGITLNIVYVFSSQAALISIKL